MANDYAIVNIKELEDQAVKFGLSPNVEARFGRKATDAKQGGFSYQKLAANFRQPFGQANGRRGYNMPLGLFENINEILTPCREFNAALSEINEIVHGFKGILLKCTLNRAAPVKKLTTQ